MEILYEFFEIVRNRLNYPEPENIEHCTDYVSYPYIFSMDEFILHNYTSKIGDKVLTLSLDKDAILSYARLLLREFKNLFDLSFKNTIIVNEKKIRRFQGDGTTFTLYTLDEASENDIVGEEYEDTYAFRTLFGTKKMI